MSHNWTHGVAEKQNDEIGVHLKWNLPSEIIALACFLTLDSEHLNSSTQGFSPFACSQCSMLRISSDGMLTSAFGSCLVMLLLAAASCCCIRSKLEVCTSMMNIHNLTSDSTLL